MVRVLGLVGQRSAGIGYPAIGCRDENIGPVRGNHPYGFEKSFRMLEVLNRLK